MDLPPEEERFSKNANVMVQAVHSGIKNLYDKGYKTVDPNLVAFIGGLINQFDKIALINGFIEQSHKECWDQIKGRNDEFFVKNAEQIFAYLPAAKVNLFTDLFNTKDEKGNPVVPDKLKKDIYGLLDALIKISIKYVHKKRSPYSAMTTNGTDNGYATKFMEDVDVNYHASQWGVKLEYPPRY